MSRLLSWRFWLCPLLGAAVCALLFKGHATLLQILGCAVIFTLGVRDERLNRREK
jgi:hypothetical protein